MTSEAVSARALLLAFLKHVEAWHAAQTAGERARADAAADALLRLLERAPAWQAEAHRLRKLFDDAGKGEHNVLALVDHYQRSAMEADERLRAVRAVLEANGCDCDCDHHHDEHVPDCERCLACRIGEAIGEADAR